LNLGGSLQELRLNNNAVIKDLYPLKYDATYAIFFPFANRIADGTYVFNNFFFDINQKEENNAIHGLVYEKTFVLVEQHMISEQASVLLRNEEKKYKNGFPYAYTIELKYSLTNDLICN
jgi:aldose 1-epimerase